MTKLPFESMDRSLVIKREYTTSDKYGKKPENRTTKEMLEFGMINVDKPAGPTSHQISGFVKDILHIDKAGHSGTLDPGVTGVLPVGLSKATRIMQSLLTAGKEYICLMHIHSDISEAEILEAVKKFQGKLMQLPPVKSAVKRELRERNVYYVEVLEISGRDVLFKMGCQAGTYVRKWCHDFGLFIGSSAHMVELRRTKSGPFTEDNLVTLQELTDAYHYYKHDHDDSQLRKIIMTPEFAVSHLRKIYVIDTAVNSLATGAYLKVPGVVKLEKDIEKGDIVAVFTLKDELVLVGIALMDTTQIMHSDRGIVVKTEQVFMERGIYPKIDKPESAE
ncbi:MAG TPA: RNA-guided pseudouridylation complex pseudouridine synthase subunit Cbf5 [Alphaproteobacteria bacterium]|nr:RNA-guided pseudouridylation complex pseudouridine synthase subunit Cbf5 [Alphaproteobacteria bacterium]